MDKAKNGSWQYVPGAISAFISSFFRPVESVLHRRSSSGYSLDTPICLREQGDNDEHDACVVGGIEVMSPMASSAYSSVELGKRRSKVSDDIQFLESSPSGRFGRHKRFPVTPHPHNRNTTSNRLHLSTAMQDKPIYDIDGEEEEENHPPANNHSRWSNGSGNNTSVISSNGTAASLDQDNKLNERKIQLSHVRVGGNDGLVDVDDDGDDDDEVQLMDGVEEPEPDISDIQTPNSLQFRFHPTITSTSDRKFASIRGGNARKWAVTRSRRDRETLPLSVYAGGVHKQYQQSFGSGRMFGCTRGIVLGNKYYRGSSSELVMGSKTRLSAAAGSRVRCLVGRLGLTKKYQSTAQECYKLCDKQAYMELLKQSMSADAGMSRGESSSSIFSSTSSFCVPFSKTHMDQEWTQQRTREIEQKRRQQKMLEQDAAFERSNISLWTLDQKDEALHYSEKAEDSLAKTTALTKPLVSGAKSNDSKPSEKFTALSSNDVEDDDIIITKENVTKVVKPNSLEKNARFNAFYKFTPDWVGDLNERREKRKADLERLRVESEMTLKICSERRKAAPSVEDVVSRRFKMLDMRHPSPRIEISVDVLIELSPEMEKVINNALRKHPSGEVLTEKFNIQITRRDIATLDGLNWLNDEVVNFYMNLLMERGQNDNYPSVYAFNTFFYPKLIKMGFSGVKRWTKKVDIFSYDLLLVPVHLGMHWCLATISVKDNLISYYDSMLGDNPQCLQELCKYLHDEHQDKKKKSTPDMGSWECETLKDIPQQMNGSDCGMFACKFSEYLSRRCPITFTQDHMPYFRRRMVYEIVTNKLL